MSGEAGCYVTELQTDESPTNSRTHQVVTEVWLQSAAGTNISG